MSRLIVKGLPTRFNDDQLRELFSFAGEVTDAKVIKTRDGKSRQFGFVGFRTSQEAKSARHRLNKSYVDTVKVSVDFARAVGDASIPRPWSKYSAGSSLHDKNSQSSEEALRKQFLAKESERNNRIRKLKEKQTLQSCFSEKDKAAFEEFQETVGKRATIPLWADGGLAMSAKTTMVASRKKGGEGRFMERKHVKFAAENSEDEEDDLYEDVPKKSVESKDGKDLLEAQNGRPDITSNKNDNGDSPEARNSLALNDEISDMDYFKSKVMGKESEVGKPESLADVQEGKPEEDDQKRIQEHERGSEEEGGTLKSDEQDEERMEGKRKQAQQRYSNNDDPDELRKPEEFKGHTRYRDCEDVDASETGRLLVRNLAYAVTSEDLEDSFERFGTIADVHVVKDAKSGKSRGMGFVQFVIPENAPKALVEMDASFHNGRIMHVLPAKPRPVSDMRPFISGRSGVNPGNSSYKAQRDEAQMAVARQGLDGRAQHTLHISSDAVAEVIAQKHGASKADLYGTSRGESGIAAVRLAMAEATIQNEARQFLLEKGVDLDIAEKLRVEAKANTVVAKRKRQSRTAFLAKNLPAGTTETDLRNVFARLGALTRLIIVPSGLLAVVEYAAFSDAKRAYNSLAYTRFQDTPLYLEWLPVDALKKTEEDPTKSMDSRPSVETRFQKDIASQPGENSGGKTRNPEQCRGNVYVKNLNFDTRDTELKSHFLKLFRKRRDVAEGFRSAKVAMKRNPKGQSKDVLSMGFGFLEFSSIDIAKEAVKVAQNTMLDGHALQLRLSNQMEDGQEKNNSRKRQLKSTGKAGPKLVVRNIAFEATKRDVRQLFSAFGQLKLVRVPRKPDGSHRGFAFIEFVSKDEAKGALKALSSTHLYGRRLVIEYAEEDVEATGSVSALQEKTAAYMARKRIRANDGTAHEPSSDDKSGVALDERAVLEDALYG